MKSFHHAAVFLWPILMAFLAGLLVDSVFDLGLFPTEIHGDSIGDRISVKPEDCTEQRTVENDVVIETKASIYYHGEKGSEWSVYISDTSCASLVKRWGSPPAVAK